MVQNNKVNRQKLLPLSGKGKDSKFSKVFPNWFTGYSICYYFCKVCWKVQPCLHAYVCGPMENTSEDCSLCTFLGVPYCSLQSVRVTFSIDSIFPGAWLSLPWLRVFDILLGESVFVVNRWGVPESGSCFRLLLLGVSSWCAVLWSWVLLICRRGGSYFCCSCCSHTRINGSN